MRQYIGAGILSFFVLYLFVESNIHAWSRHPFVFLGTIVLMLFAMVSIAMVFHKANRTKATYPPFEKPAFIDFFSVFLGAISTFLLAVYLDVNVVLASGLIGTIAALFFKPYAVAVFCGSFLGMSSPGVFDLLPFVLASLLASLIYVMAKDVFNGFGGKLGTVALSGGFISAILHGSPHLEGTFFNIEETLLIVLAAVFGAVVSNLLNVRYAQGAVFGSAFVGIIAGGILPYVFETNGMVIAIVMFGASFVGMSSRKVLVNEFLVGLTGMVFGFLFVYTAHAMGGLGGKLGTLALSSVLSIYGIRLLISLHKGDETHG